MATQPTPQQVIEGQKQDWNRVAGGWEKWDRLFEAQMAFVNHRLVADARLHEGLRVLDLGSGTGYPALLGAQVVGPAGSVVGMDLAEQMLAAAARKAKTKKSNIKKAFEKYNSDGKISSVVLSTVRHFINNSYASPEKVKFMLNHLAKKITKNSKEEMNFMLMGGREAIEWANTINKQMEEADSKRIRYYAEEGENLMPYSSLKDINPSLKGIDPPISLAQANQIARQADAVGADKGGWGIAIKHFKESHVVKDGRWVTKTEMSKQTNEKEEIAMADEEMKKEEEVSAKTEKMAEVEVEVEDKVEVDKNHCNILKYKAQNLVDLGFLSNKPSNTVGDTISQTCSFSEISGISSKNFSLLLFLIFSLARTKSSNV